MKIISDFKKNLFHKEVLKKKNQYHFSNHPVTLQEARHIGILFDATQIDDRKEVVAFIEKLKKQEKKVQALAFLDDTLTIDSLPFRYFNRKALDWKGRPVHEFADAFAREKFDMLFCLYPSSSAPLEYIAVQSLSRFKIGAHQENTACFDLAVVPDQTDAGYMIRQIEHILSRLRTSQHEEIIP